MNSLASPPLLREFIDKLLSLDRALQVPGKVHSEHGFLEKLLVTVDAAPVLLAYIDSSERYRFCNQTYERWFGLGREHILGRHIREVLGDAAYAHLRADIQAALAGQRLHFEREVPYRTGGTRRVSANYLPHVLPDGRVAGYVGMVTDVTDLRRGEEAMRDFSAAHLARLRADRLFAVSSALSQALLPEEVAHVVVREGALALEARTASLALVSADGTAFELAASHGFPEDVVGGWRRFPLDTPVMFREAWRTGRPVLYETLEHFLRDYPEQRDSPALLGRAFAAIPLRVDGRTLGAFGFSFERERAFSTEELRFMESIGHQCSVAIERARLYAAERQARAEAERLRDELSAERARLEAVLRQLPVGVVIAEPDGRMVMGNAAIDSIIRRPFKLSASIPDYALNHTGYREDGSRIAPEDWPLTRSLRQGLTVVKEPVTLRHPDGALTKVELSSAPVRDAEGRTVAGVVVVNDVTAHHELQEALRREADVREKLIGIVSHDLRSPLQAIITSGELLLRSQTLTPPQQRWAQRIQASTRRMSHLIRDLLDFARVRQGGTLPVQPQLIRLEEACRGAVDELLAAHPQRLILLDVRGATFGEWDPDRMEQLVGNLVTNALTHGAEGSPVEVRLNGEGEALVLEVANTGNPIPPALLTRIFEPFTRASTEGDALKGVGLGLFIVHEIVTAHGGHIQVSSSAEAGTVFRVTLPRRPPS